MGLSIRSLAFHSFKKRLLILIVGLIGLAQGATLVLALGYVYRDVYPSPPQRTCTRRKPRYSSSSTRVSQHPHGHGRGADLRFRLQGRGCLGQIAPPSRSTHC